MTNKIERVLMRRINFCGNGSTWHEPDKKNTSGEESGLDSQKVDKSMMRSRQSEAYNQSTMMSGQNKVGDSGGPRKVKYKMWSRFPGLQDAMSSSDEGDSD